jgi:hypothetical protein
MTTCVPPHLSEDAANMYAVAPMFPSIVTVCAWPLFDQTSQADMTQRSFRRRRPKRETPLDIAKRQQAEDAAIKFCPWCGKSFRPCYKFCMYCGEAPDARRTQH